MKKKITRFLTTILTVITVFTSYCPAYYVLADDSDLEEDDPIIEVEAVSDNAVETVPLHLEVPFNDLNPEMQAFLEDIVEEELSEEMAYAGVDMRQLIADILDEEVGYTEGGNNWNKFAAELNAAGWTCPQNAAWCAILAAWAVYKAGLDRDLWPASFASTNRCINWFRDCGRWHCKVNYSWENSISFDDGEIDGYTPQVADFVAVETNYCASDGPDHTGMVFQVADNGRTIVTIEGNSSVRGASSDGVDYHEYHWSNYYERYVSENTNSVWICGVANPDYGPENTIVDPEYNIDSIDIENGKIRIVGWIFDPADRSRTVEIHVWIGAPAGNGNAKEAYGQVYANDYRPDVHNVYGCGNYHGIDDTHVLTARGTQKIYIYAIDKDGHWGGNRQIYEGQIDIKGVQSRIDFERSSYEVKAGNTVGIKISYDGDNVADLAYRISDPSVLSYVNYSNYNANSRSIQLNFKGLKGGKATVDVYLRDSNNNDFYGKSVTVSVIQPVTGVEFEQKNATLTVGQSVNLKANVLPTDATNKSVEYSSSNKNVVTVDSSGRIKGITAGNAIITARTKDGGKEAKCSVTVKSAKIEVEKVKLSNSEAVIEKGSKYMLYATVEPSSATEKTVIWTSSDRSIVEVSSSGVLTAKKAGNSIITAEAGGKKATCKVKVVVPIEQVKLNKTEVNLNIGNTEKLALSIVPVDYTQEYTMSWTSSNSKIATVDKGLIMAVGEGTTDIKAVLKSNGNTYEAACRVNVKANVVYETGVTLNEKELNLEVNESNVLTATLKPENTTFKNLKWTTSAPAVATVFNGMVTGVGFGDAEIMVTTENGKSASCTVHVDVPASIELSGSNEDSMEVGQDLLIEYIYFGNPSDRIVVDVEDQDIAKCYSTEYSHDGKTKGQGYAGIKAYKKGTSYVNISLVDSDNTVRESVKIQIAVSEKEPTLPDPTPTPSEEDIIDCGSVDIVTMQKYDIADFFRSKLNYDMNNIKFKSSNKQAVSISKKGVIKAKRECETTITMYYQNAGRIVNVASCQVHVYKPEYSFAGETLTFKGESIDANEYIYGLPEGAEIRWKRQSGSAASVDENGRITAIKSGTIKVTCYIGRGKHAAKYTASLKVKIPKLAKSCSIKAGKSKKIALKNYIDTSTVYWTAEDGIMLSRDYAKENVVNVTAGYNKGDYILTAYVDGHPYTMIVKVR